MLLRHLLPVENPFNLRQVRDFGVFQIFAELLKEVGWRNVFDGFEFHSTMREHK